MNKSVEDTRRNLFEAWADDEGFNLWYRFKGGGYADSNTLSAWQGFNAALDLVEFKELREMGEKK